MERNRDLRRATVSAVNGLPRRRQRITTLRDSTDQDRQMELQETVRLGDRELLPKKDREREFSKRRRIDRPGAQQRSDGGESCREDESTDSSDEEYYEEEEDVRIHQHKISPTSSSLSNSRRGLRTLRSSPVLRASADEMFGVRVPRRARSSSARRLQEYCKSGSGGHGEDPSHRRFSPSPAASHPIGCGDSMRKKMKSLERRPPMSNPKNSVIQDDIEIEVAEALFDLMKQSQSQSQSQSSQRQEKVNRDSANTASDELKMSKADGGKDDNNAFSVQNEPSIKVNAETNSTDSMKERKREGRVEKEKFPDDPARELVSGDGFVNKVKVGSPKESESPSCVKVNACDIQDPTVTKAHYEAIIVEAKKETKLEIDLMSSPLPSSPERDGMVDVRAAPVVIGKKSEIVPKDGRLAVASGENVGVANGNQQFNLDVEKYSRNATHQQQGRKEHKNQSPTSLLSFPVGMNSWPGVLPHPGFMPTLQALPISGSARSSMIMQPPQFKFSKPRPKRCATHQYLAQSILSHQQLIRKSLSSGSTGPAALCGSNSPKNPKYTPPNFIPGDTLLGEFQGGQNLATASVGSGKDKSSSSNATTSSKSLLHQTPHPASASSFLHGHGFLLPFGHHQTAKMVPTNSSGSSQSASSAGNATLLSSSAGGRLPVNLPLPNPSTAMSLNNPMITSNEAAASYMAMIQNNGSPIPIPMNMAMPPFRGGSASMPFFSPSLYPSPAFSVTPNQSASQNMNLSSHKQQTIDNKFPSVPGNSQSEKSDTEINWKNGASLAPAFGSHSVKPNNSHNYPMFPPASIGSGSKQNDPPQQGSKGRVEMVPQAFAFSFGSNVSATPVLNFSSMAQNSGMFHLLPEMSRNGNQMMHQKNLQPSEGKSVGNGGQSFSYSRPDSSEMSALATMGPPKFDNVARNINFLPSSISGSQPFQTSTGASVPNFQQHQLIQIQDHHTHQMHLGGNIPVFSAPNEAPLFHPKWENLPRSGAPEGSHQLKSSSTHISFGNGGPVSATSYQGHQFMFKNESSNSSMSRNTPSSQRNTSATPPPPPNPQEAEGGGATQKSSSPACRRNVPSIVSTCPPQLPELKY